MMVNNIPVNGWPQLKDLEAVQPILNRLDKIEAWKRTVKEETFTGEEITIDSALALPARSLKTVINAIQDLHGQPFPYVGGAYKNKFNLANIDTDYFSVNNQTITNTQTDTVNKFELYVQTMNNGSIVDRVGDMIIESTGRKSLSFTLSGTFTHLRFKHNGYSRDLIIALMPWTATGDFTISFDVVGYNPSTAGGLVLSNIQLESGSTATSFAPYSNICPISGRDSVVLTRSDGDEISEDFTIQLGQTVYGAEVNWDTGVMTVDRKIYTFSGTGEDWTLDGKRFKFLKPSDWAGESAQYANPDKVISNQATLLYNDVYGAYFSITNGWLWVNALDSSETLASFRARLAETPIQIVGMLATPTTIQLTPTQLEMLKGYNHITLSDGYGTIELKALTGANWS